MIKLQQLCGIIKGRLKGDPGYEILSVNSLEKAGKEEITFAAKDTVKLEQVKAGALIVAEGSKIDYANLIYVPEPYAAFAALLEFFFPRSPFNEGIAGQAYVSPTARTGSGVSIGMFSYIGDNVEIGEDSEIHSGVQVYHNVKIGKNCLIYANVVIREDVEIGDHVIIQPGAVIGGDGFGFTRLSDGTPIKIPQKGKVIIGSHCEIGSNTCIDRSTVEETVLEDYVKLDNLVQIGHNVSIGRGTALSGQVGISGSVKIGKNVIMGGQVGVGDHIKIADGVMLAGKTGVVGNIKEENSIHGGYPHQDIRQWRKSSVIFRNLEKYIDRIRVLEKKIKKLEENEK
ncbi:MAG: UDP-3-O-(3-hydroxymyristoyl)glucosamine N-acyltransferase [Candidatus Aminicenantes bacterium]|nr:UDP-3-O-(3-hydroxymyristoyl)glucosamine N-acyltransferase [Candidatus Aminicenantes bacterium]